MIYRYRISVLFILLLGFKLARAQSAEGASSIEMSEIKAIESQQLTKSSYENAAEFWKIRTSMNNKSEEAWLNYYKAVRYSDYTDRSRKISSSTLSKLQEIIGEIERNVGESYAFHYASYLQQNRSSSSFAHLENAFLLKPEESELWDDMLCKSVIEKKNPQIEFFARKLSETSIYSAAELEYNQNVLNSVEQNAILVTNGNVDTYPLIILQQTQNFRKDVRIICLDWFNNSTYLRDLANSDSKLFGKLIINQPYESLKSIAKNSNNKSLYLGLTIPGDEIGDLSKDLYCTGLAMKYSNTALSNLISLETNWNQFFSKTFLTQSEPINRNYILPLVLLNDYYKESGHSEHAAAIQKLLQTIGANFEMQSTLQKHMD